MSTQNRTFVKATSLTVGQSLTGKVKALEPGKYDKTNVLMEGADGSLFVLFIAGNLGDAIENGDIAVGKKVTITRRENANGTNKQTGKAYTVSQFDVTEAPSLFAKTGAKTNSANAKI